MNRDFFTAQRYHKKISLIFYALFFLAVVIHALLLLLLCLLASYTFIHDAVLSYWLTCLVGLGLYIFFGWAVGRYRVRLGGVGLAKKMGAVRLFVSPQASNTAGDIANDDTANDGEVVYYPNFIKVNQPKDFPSSYARLYEFVAQMSIASGVAMPLVYVLPNQMGINAWVAGFERSDTVMVFTQGAADKLDNDALYGLIGHEFGHILHGDGRLNLRIYALMASFSWLYEASEWVESMILGSMAQRTYTQAHTPTIGHHQNPLIEHLTTKEQWVQYWREQQHKEQQSRQQDNYLPQDALHLLLRSFRSFYPLMMIIVLWRALGALGMATQEWIVSRFNRQRELLADATSIQLTRSFGLLDLLYTIDDEGQSTQLTGQYSTHMGYFFFANPDKSKGIFDAHPSIDERIQAINGQWYNEFGGQMVAHLDKARLSNAQKAIHQHTTITPLAQELTQSDYQTVAFEAPSEQIVDGRLVVDKAWYDWQTPSSQRLDSQNTDSLSLDNQSLTNQSSSHTHDNHAHDDHAPLKTHVNHHANKPVLQMSDLKDRQTPWEIVKHQRHVVGVLALIEVLLLCRYDEIYPNDEVDFFDIFIKTAYNDDNHRPMTERILPHTLSQSLIKAVAGLNRQADGLQIVQAVKALLAHLHNPNIPIHDKQQAMLQRYWHGLEQVMALPAPKQSDWQIKAFERLRIKILKVWQAAVLALLYQSLYQSLQTSLQADHHQHSHHNTATQVLAWVGKGGDGLQGVYQKPYQDWHSFEQISVILLAFFVSTQDNRLLLEQTDVLCVTLRRWLRLLAIDDTQIDEALLIQLIYKSHQVGVAEWASLFVILSDYPMADKKRLHDTLHTAVLYDATINQKEMDILLMLQLLWLDAP